ncbi:hypothetical protein [[Mycoplasma] anseris]|uniref:Lipoprotein n=1 Tax=[Mycoplasma] anseris TaxID=92400 RepID=A0A2Z4NCV2_9BACT|nr:hypothetical protein [[Mycoplasma] anseris]AWX69401.1 hypothetical protein DP065_01365 [[Mycoplasma] anseris]
MKKSSKLFIGLGSLAVCVMPIAMISCAKSKQKEAKLKTQDYLSRLKNYFANDSSDPKTKELLKTRIEEMEKQLKTTNFDEMTDQQAEASIQLIDAAISLLKSAGINI